MLADTTFARLRSATLAVTALAGVLTAQSSQAATVLTATLTGSQEVPPAISVLDPMGGVYINTASGFASFLLNDAMTALTFTVTVNGIDFTGTQTSTTVDNLTAAHIHAPARPGEIAPVVFGFIGNPFNDTSPRDTVVTPFLNGVGGTVTSKWDAPEGNNTTLMAQVPNLLAGLAYINFHTVGFPGGQIRGQIVPGPIAGAGLPALMALGGFVWARRRTLSVCRRSNRRFHWIWRS